MVSTHSTTLNDSSELHVLRLSLSCASCSSQLCHRRQSTVHGSTAWARATAQRQTSETNDMPRDVQRDDCKLSRHRMSYVESRLVARLYLCPIPGVAKLLQYYMYSIVHTPLPACLSLATLRSSARVSSRHLSTNPSHPPLYCNVAQSGFVLSKLAPSGALVERPTRSRRAPHCSLALPCSHDAWSCRDMHLRPPQIHAKPPQKSLPRHHSKTPHVPKACYCSPMPCVVPSGRRPSSRVSWLETVAGNY